MTCSVSLEVRSALILSQREATEMNWDCIEGNRYRVFVNAEGRVVTQKQ